VTALLATFFAGCDLSEDEEPVLVALVENILLMTSEKALGGDGVIGTVTWHHTWKCGSFPSLFGNEFSGFNSFKGSQSMTVFIFQNKQCD